MRLAIISDIHEDLISLKSALRIIERSNCDEIVCLGDISGFSIPYYSYLGTRNAHECLSLIRSNCKIVVLGNHDIHAAEIIPKHCTFFDFPEDWYRLNYHDRHQLANNTLWLHEENDLNPLYKSIDLDYLRSLPEYEVFQTPDCNILLTHYVYPNISGLKKEFYTYGDEFQQHFQFMQQQDCSVGFTGHSHTKGFFMATEKSFKQYRYRRKTLPEDPVCIGISPVTSSGNRNAVCIFDTYESQVELLRI